MKRAINKIFIIGSPSDSNNKLKKVSKEEAESLKAKLEEAGAEVELK